MSERIQVSYQGRNVSLSKPANALVQSVLEEVCATLKVADPLSHRLVVERGEKAIDHSLSIRQANLKSPAKLALVKAPASRSQMVVATLVHKERSFTATVHTNTTLFALLQHIEQQQSSSSSGGGEGEGEKLQWTDWHGIPEPEVNAQFEVHIHVPGYMQPCVEIGPRKINTNEELKRITLFNLGLHSDSRAPAKVRMKLSHSYTPPQRSEEEKQAVIDNFQRRYQDMLQSMGQGAASAANNAAAAAPQSLAHAHAARITIEEEEEVDVASEEEEEEAEAAPFTLPADRRMQLLHAQPGMLKAPELPEEFYEVTEEDALEYAKSIRREALRSGALRAGDKMPTDLPLNEEKSAAASSSPLLDSSRLPAVPPSHSRRVARAKRKCKATLLRIRLPNHLYAEGLFKTDETPADVYHWLDSLLVSEEGVKLKDKYYLYITPPRQQLSRTSKLTLMQLGLIPQALVHYGEPTQRNMTQGVGAFVLPEESKEEKKQKERVAGAGLLKPEWLERVQHVLPPTPPPTNAADESNAATEKKEDESSGKDRASAEATPATAAGSPSEANPSS